MRWSKYDRYRAEREAASRDGDVPAEEGNGFLDSDGDI